MRSMEKLRIALHSAIRDCWLSCSNLFLCSVNWSSKADADKASATSSCISGRPLLNKSAPRLILSASIWLIFFNTAVWRFLRSSSSQLFYSSVPIAHGFHNNFSISVTKNGPLKDWVYYFIFLITHLIGVFINQKILLLRNPRCMRPTPDCRILLHIQIPRFLFFFSNEFFAFYKLTK